MYYYIYEIKNKINGKIYVGVHKTATLEDGYMGSGKIIKDAIKKYGLDNFEKRIIKTFDNPEDMFSAEASLVNEEFLERDDVYNLRRGGYGGFDYIIKSGQHRSVSYKGIPLTEEHVKKMVETRRERFELGEYESAQKIWSENARTNNPMKNVDCKEKVREANTGIPKTDEHKRKISEALTGHPGLVGKKYPNRKQREPVVTRIEICPHCGKSGGIHGMTRWHFDNCKYKQG